MAKKTKLSELSKQLGKTVESYVKDKFEISNKIKSALGITELEFDSESYFDDNDTGVEWKIIKINYAHIELHEYDLQELEKDTMISYQKSLGKISKNEAIDLIKQATVDNSKEKVIAILALLAKVDVAEYINGLSDLISSKY